MPVYNRPKHTKQTIDSLYKNTTEEFALVVINDKSDLTTEFYLQELQKKYGFTLLHNKTNNGPGYSRNKGCDYISKEGLRGDYLYFSDNDVYFTKGWLGILLEVYRFVSMKGISLIGGGCHPYLQNNGVMELGETSDNIKRYLGLKDAVSGYSHLTSWEMWERFGPFETQVGLDKKIGRSDDWKFCNDMKEAGFDVGSVYPEVVIATGKTDSYGNPANGVETFKEISGVNIE